MHVVQAVAALDPNSVSPGVAGFLTVFFLALATWLLIRSMIGHLRKVRYRAEQEAAEAAATAAASARAEQTAARVQPKKGKRR
jgi:hypothetical protein